MAAHRVGVEQLLLKALVQLFESRGHIGLAGCGHRAQAHG